MARRAQGGADRLRPLVLPGEDGGQRLARAAVPDHAGFALRAQAHRDDALRGVRIERFGRRAPDARPDLPGVLLDPAGLRRRERYGRLGAADDRAPRIDHERLGRARALIDGEKERAAHVTGS